MLLPLRFYTARHVFHPTLVNPHDGRNILLQSFVNLKTKIMVLLFRLVRLTGRQRQRTHLRIFCAVPNCLSGHLNATTFMPALFARSQNCFPVGVYLGEKELCDLQLPPQPFHLRGRACGAGAGLSTFRTSLRRGGLRAFDVSGGVEGTLLRLALRTNAQAASGAISQVRFSDVPTLMNLQRFDIDFELLQARCWTASHHRPRLNRDLDQTSTIRQLAGKLERRRPAAGQLHRRRGASAAVSAAPACGGTSTPMHLPAGRRWETLECPKIFGMER